LLSTPELLPLAKEPPLKTPLVGLKDQTEILPFAVNVDIDARLKKDIGPRGTLM